MTDKQRNVLADRLTEDRITKLEMMGFKRVSSFIELVLHFNKTSVPVLKRNPTTEESKVIEEIVDANREGLGLVKDEYASVKEVRYFIGGTKWFVLDQYWFKGESNTPTHRYTLVNSNGTEKFEGIYNALFDTGIYSLTDFIEYLTNSLQITIDKQEQ